MGVKPITSRAAGSCVKNSLLKQTVSKDKPKDKPIDITTQTGNITTVSESSTPISTAGDYNIIGNKTTKKIKKPGTTGTPEIRRTLLYSDLPEEAREAARKDNLEKFGTHNPTREGLANNTIVVQEAVKGIKPTEIEEVDESPEYETVKGSGTLDVRGDFRRGQIAQRTSGKMAKKALRFDKKAERLTKKGKTDKAAIYRNKAEDSRKTSQRIRNKQDQFDIQEKQGGTGTSSYSTIKIRESLDAAKRRISDGSTSSSNESRYQHKTPDLAKKLGLDYASSFLKKNYFKNK